MRFMPFEYVFVLADVVRLNFRFSWGHPKTTLLGEKGKIETSGRGETAAGPVVRGWCFHAAFLFASARVKGRCRFKFGK